MIPSSQNVWLPSLALWQVAMKYGASTDEACIKVWNVFSCHVSGKYYFLLLLWLLLMWMALCTLRGVLLVSDVGKVFFHCIHFSLFCYVPPKSWKWCVTSFWATIASECNDKTLFQSIGQTYWLWTNQFDEDDFPCVANMSPLSLNQES